MWSMRPIDQSPMSLGRRLTLLLALILAVYLGANIAVQRLLVYPSFVRLDREEALLDLERCISALNAEVTHLSTFCSDWRLWDDSFAFVADGHEGFKETNLSDEEYFVTQGLSVLAFYDARGKPIWVRTSDETAENRIDIPEIPTDGLPLGHPFFAALGKVEEDVSGIMMSSAGPLVVSAGGVYPSDRSGTPNGILVFARHLGPKLVEKLRSQTAVDLRLAPRSADEPLEGTRPIIDDSKEGQFLVTSSIRDLTGKPILDATARVNRDISRRGEESVRYATLSLILAAMIVGGATLITLRLLVVRPLAVLTRHAKNIGTSDDLSTRLRLDRSDEIGQLGMAFDDMVNKVADSRARFAELSRAAGMSELARNVVHNIGNVLTNISVLVGSMRQRAGKDKFGGLRKAADLLASPAAGGAGFLTEDARGKMIPGYLSQLAALAESERSALNADLVELDAGVSHIRQVLAAQESLARPCEAAQECTAEEICRAALELVRSSFERHRIRVVTEIASVPTLRLDRSRVMQVLVNLLSNAKDALERTPPESRTVALRVSSAGPDRVRVTIEDCGKGIAADVLTRIFSRGVSTKGEGHGLGLHYCANTAKEMGGTLTAASDGPGRGARFTLELPISVGAQAKARAA